MVARGPRRVLVTGAGGLLGRALVQHAVGRADLALTGLPRAELDITEVEAVEAALDRSGAEVVINAAAYTQVDRAQSEPAAALAANVAGPAVLAGACAERGVAVVQVSSDHVFGGQAGRLCETDELPAPASVYGLTKLGGEQVVQALAPRHYVVRIAGLFGPGGRNFVEAIVRRAQSGEPLRGVDDQICSRSYSEDVAEALLELVTKEPPWGLYHFCNAGGSSWYEFAQAVLATWDLRVPLEPISSAAYGAPAPRPAWSVLSLASWTGAGLTAPRHELEALAAYRATWSPRA